MGIPLLRGRSFGSQDTATSTRVAVINRLAAEKFFDTVDPLGRRFSTGDGKDGPTWYTVIGICANTRYDSMRKEPEPLHFDLMRQAVGTYGATFMVRTALPLRVIGPLLRQRVAQVDADLPITNLQTFQDQINDDVREEQLFAALAAGFGMLALALACIGVYGVMAYTVSQRTQEIGVRLTLGAPRSQVRGLVLGEAAVLAVAGVLAGLACTLLLTRVVASMLYGVQPHDTRSMVCGSLLMLLVALIACWIPAARASRIDPVIALRHE